MFTSSTKELRGYFSENDVSNEEELFSDVSSGNELDSEGELEEASSDEEKIDINITETREEVLHHLFPKGVDDIILNYLRYDIQFPKKPYRLTLFKEKNVLPFMACQHVLHGGELFELKKLIKANHYLLDLIIHGIDPVERTGERTLYQHALASGDLGMVNMLKKLIVVYRGKEVEEKQRRQQFPENWKKLALDKLNNDANELDKLIFVIMDAKALTTAELIKECYPAIKAFKNYIVASNDLAKIGFDFNIQFLEFAVQRLKEHIIDMDNLWGEGGIKADLFCKAIIGFLQRCLSARDAHYLIYGLCYIDKTCNFIFLEESDEDIPRELFFRNKVYYYNLVTEDGVLGKNRFVTCDGTRKSMLMQRTEVEKLYELLQKYVEVKYKQYDNILNGHEPYHSLIYT